MMALRPTLRLHPMSASMLLVVARGLESCASKAFYHAPGAGTTGASYAQASWAPEGFRNYSLVAKRSAGRNSSLLTFALPAGMPTLGAQVISGVKVRRTLAGEALDKSYSPSSHAEAEGTFDLLVKSYEPVKGGGLGHFLCAMEPGDEVEMKVKGAKKINGAPLGRRQYARIGMLAGGTGVAPFMNLVATLLADAEDETLLDLVVSHSEAEDAMLRGELEGLAARSGGRLRVHHTFSRASGDAAAPAAARGGGGGGDGGPFFSEGVGRIDAALAAAMLPSADADDVLVLVCGTDGFVDSMAGAITRVRDPVTNVKSKVQGPTTGVLGGLGFAPHQVFKL